MRPFRLLLPLLLASSGFLPAAETAGPNVIFILTDDSGRGDWTTYGGNQGATPNVDRLASEGLKFTQFYVGAPICSASRAAFTTGMFPARVCINSYLHQRAGNRLCDQVNWLDPKWPTLARTLKTAGYATAHFGKWHLGGGRDVQDAPLPSAYGFDESHVNCEGMGPRFENFGNAVTPTLNTLDGKKYFRYEFTEYWVNRSIDFIKRHQSGPFYLELWPQDVHTPHTPSKEALARTAAPGLTKAQHNFRAVLNEYDHQIGRFLDTLRDMGLESNTIVVFSADNGPEPSFDHARTLGQRGMKWSLYEGGIHEPFMVRWPGKIPAGKVNDSSVVSSVDYFATICALVGVKPPADASFDGMDMSRAWRGGNESRTNLLFWEYGRSSVGYIYPRPDLTDISPNVAIRDGNWKLLVGADGSGAELYDLSVDPRETKNFAAEKPDETARLAALALKWRKSLPHAPQSDPAAEKFPLPKANSEEQ
jgi:arylsulfatase A-like enzyme